MKPGIYYDMPFEEYANVVAFSSSYSKYLDICPAALRDYLDSRQDTDSKAKRIGRALHEALLLPMQSSAREACKPIEVVIANGMATSLGCSAVFKYLSRDSVREVSLFWNCPDTKVLCKARIDLYNEKEHALLDVKSTSIQMEDRNLSIEIHKRLYYRQMAWYTIGLEACGKRVDKQILAFVGSSRPYLYKYRALTLEALEQGKREMRELVKVYSLCVDTETWPGYPDKIEMIDLPEWAKTVEVGIQDFSGYETENEGARDE